MSRSESITIREVESSDLETFYEHQLAPEAIRMAAFVGKDPKDKVAFDDHWDKILNSSQNTTRTIVVEGQVAGHISCYPDGENLEVTYWLNKADTISTKVTVMPDVWWQTRANGAFAEAKDNMLRQPGVKLISEDNFAAGDCRAYSLVVALKNRFQRIDFYLMKPDLRVLMYLSPKEDGLSDTACKSLFDSVAIKPKSRHQ